MKYLKNYILRRVSKEGGISIYLGSTEYRTGLLLLQFSSVAALALLKSDELGFLVSIQMKYSGPCLHRYLRHGVILPPITA